MTCTAPGLAGTLLRGHQARFPAVSKMGTLGFGWWRWRAACREFDCGPPLPGCPVVASPAPGVLVDSESPSIGSGYPTPRHPVEALGMPTPHPGILQKEAASC